MRDSLHVVLSFCRKTKHEIKFYLIPSTFEGFSGTMQDILLGKSLVDDITQTLRSCLRCKSQTAFFDILYFTHNIQCKGVDSKRRQRNIYCLLTEFIDQKIYDLLEVTVITGA